MVTRGIACAARRVLLAVWLVPGLALAALQAQVDRNPVALDETFTLTLRSGDSSDDPDLSVLKRDFDLLGQAKSSAIQIVNGSFNRSTEWRITLSAKRAGQVPIPAIRAGNQASAPIVLNVTATPPPGSSATAPQQRVLFVEVDASPRTVYVQQQIVFTVRLFRSADLGNDNSLSAPEFPNMDAVVKPLGEDREFQTQRNGRIYAVTERRYAVFPQRSGSFASTPVIFDGALLENDNGMFAFDPFLQRSRPVRARSPSLEFTVRAIPPGAAGAAWLPAEDLQLEEAWSENPPVFRVGEPVTRMLRIRARGLTAAQLPAVDLPPVEGLRIYPDQPVLSDTPDAGGITGLREQKSALIPTRPGRLRLPAVELRWWNTATHHEAIARLPAREFDVLPARGVQNPAQPQPALAPRPPALGSSPPPQTAAAQGRFGLDPANGWIWLSLAFASAWMLTLLVLRRRRVPLTETPRAAQPQSAARTQIEKRIERDCLANDAAATQRDLLAWAAQRWPDDPPTSLGVLAARCAPPLSAAVHELDRALYAKPGGAWQGATLWRAFREHKPDARIARHDETDALEPLYRDNG